MFRGTDKGSVLADTWEATVSILAKSEEKNPDFTNEIKTLSNARKEQLKLYNETVNAEIDAMKGFADSLN